MHLRAAVWPAWLCTLSLVSKQALAANSDMRPGCANLIKFVKVHDVDAQTDSSEAVINTDYDSGDPTFKTKKLKKMKTVKFSTKNVRRGNKMVKRIVTDAYTVATSTAASATSTTTGDTTSSPPASATTDPTNFDDSLHVIILMDETGSMQRYRDKMIRAYNKNLVANKDKYAGTNRKVTYTYIGFNTELKIHEWGNIKKAKELTHADYNPGFNTRLYDSIGCICDRHSDERDTVFLIWSDGQNVNHLKDIYTSEDIKEKINHHRQEYNWKFYFIGAANGGTEESALRQETEVLGFQPNEVDLFEGGRINKSMKHLKSALSDELFGDSFEFMGGPSRKSKGKGKGNRKGKGKGKGKRRRMLG